MNLIECTLAGGGKLKLEVTCDSVFAGTTITCTDGVTTLTQTCPSASPYTVFFKLPNGGEWTISGTYNGTTYTENVLVDLNAILELATSITVDFYSAANDTVTYVGIDNVVHTITTNSSGYASATFTIKPSGSTLTFISSVAKNPDSLQTSYTKEITLTSSTQSVYFMPNENTLYWWGYRSSNLQNCSTANGWVISWGSPFDAITANTNYINISANDTYSTGGVATGSTLSNLDKYYAICKGISKNQGTNYGGISAVSEKRFNEGGTEILVGSDNNLATINKIEIDLSEITSEYYLRYGCYSARTDVYALWYD